MLKHSNYIGVMQILPRAKEVLLLCAYVLLFIIRFSFWHDNSNLKYGILLRFSSLESNMSFIILVVPVKCPGILIPVSNSYASIHPYGNNITTTKFLLPKTSNSSTSAPCPGIFSCLKKEISISKLSGENKCHINKSNVLSNVPYCPRREGWPLTHMVEMTRDWGVLLFQTRWPSTKLGRTESKKKKKKPTVAEMRAAEARALCVCPWTIAFLF